MQVSSYLFQSPYSQPVQIGRPDPVQEQKQAAQEQSAKSKEKDNVAEQKGNGFQSKPAEINVKSSAMYQNGTSSENTTEAVDAFINVAKNAHRSEYINAYAASEKNG